LPQHQQLTELSVANPQQLPKTYRIGQSQAVQFSVRNRTGSATTYTYVITETNPAGNRLAQLGTGSITTAANSTTVVSQIIVPADLGKRVHINVQLNTGLSVGYWVER
jgi:hypothetical protein